MWEGGGRERVGADKEAETETNGGGEGINSNHYSKQTQETVRKDAINRTFKTQEKKPHQWHCTLILDLTTNQRETETETETEGLGWEWRRKIHSNCGCKATISVTVDLLYIF